MGMSVGLLPITGIPLPFISLGGSALLVNFISFGIILNISMERTIERK
jgi:rod shape determining protein RodA